MPGLDVKDTDNKDSSQGSGSNTEHGSAPGSGSPLLDQKVYTLWGDELKR